MARFVPIVRTFAPFVAGIGSDEISALHQLQPGGSDALGGPADCRPAISFAHNEIVKKRFDLVIMAIIFISILPMLIELTRGWLKSRALRRPPKASRPPSVAPALKG